MAEEGKNKLLDSPLYAFVEKGWVNWSQEIVSVQAGAEDFMLYLVWALDSIKEQSDGINSGLWGQVYNGLRNRFIESQFRSEKADIDYLTNLVCAAAMACFGLALTGSPDNQEIYSELVNGFEDHWKDVNKLKHSLEIDSCGQDLKAWVTDYLAGDFFYTYNDVIDWNNDYMAARVIRMSKDIEKVDMLRVIMALYELGAFEAVSGKLTKAKVFKAFGDMLGENFDNFNNNLAAGSVTRPESIDIFERLQTSFEKYESSKDNKLRKQGRPTRRVEPE
ncbi:MAG: hypothetical protein IKZ60_01665 [Bacteroidales bacterium]|nr:hypothetical protein [Bacteroidales bacterium]